MTSLKELEMYLRICRIIMMEFSEKIFSDF